MRTNTLTVAIMMISLIAVGRTALAQAPSMARVVLFSSKPGFKAPMEEAIKQQMAWRREHKDSWRWLTWEYVSGEVPRYSVMTFAHSWTDLDHALADEQAEEAAGAAVSMLSPTLPVVQYYEHLEGVSDFGTQTNTPTLVEISIFQLHYGKTAQFYAALRDFHEALSSGGGSNRYEWFELRSGGDTPQFMLMVPRANWEAFDTRADLLPDRLEAVLGKKKAAKLLERFTSSVKSHQRSVVRLRPDLSLVPIQKSPEP